MSVKPPWGGGARQIGAALLLLATALVLAAWALVGSTASAIAIRLIGSIVGLSPAVLHRFGKKSGQMPDWNRRLLLIAIPALTALCVATPWLNPHYDEYRAKTPNCPPFGVLGVISGAGIVPVAMACVWVKPPPSAYMRDAVRCVLSYWVILLIWTLYSGVTAPLAMHHSKGMWFYFNEFYRNYGMKFEGIVIFYWTAWMMVSRFRALDGGSSVASKHAGVLVGVMAAAFQAATSVLTLSPIQTENPTTVVAVYLFLILVFQGVWSFYTVVLARHLFRSVRLIRAEMRSVSGAPRAEAAWACRVLTLELAGTVALGITTPCTWTALAVKDVLRHYHVDPPGLITGVSIVHRVDLLLNAVLIAVLSGLLGQVGKPRFGAGKAPEQDADQGCKAVRQDTLFSACSDDSEETKDWKDKVEELANRGVRLEDLLLFWSCLIAEDGPMPGFVPQRSTTNDVVRRAVIPISRDPGPAGGGSALASVWSKGAPRPAECMVTHNWSNLFWHLVAAIAADAMGEDCYRDVATKLLSKEGAAELYRDLEAKGRTGRTYWVCAFSINQHAGICDAFNRPPPDAEMHGEWDLRRRDSVTQEVFPGCYCEQPKILNSQPALCEMNKFDSMMRLLNRRIPNFCHLVVVDSRFEVFHRAWCVAEIVESGVSGIPQRIIIHSQEALDCHYLSLSNLDVRECQASRDEDRDMILRGITDIDRFNCELQWAIFGTKGLFQKWVDGEERSALIRRILVRARTCSSGRAGSGTPAAETQPALRRLSWSGWLFGRSTELPDQASRTAAAGGEGGPCLLGRSHLPASAKQVLEESPEVLAPHMAAEV